jgi:hypothetical protein
MFKSHFIKLNHCLKQNRLDSYGAPVLHLIIVPLFLAAEMCTNILSKLDIYGAATIGPAFLFLVFVVYSLLFLSSDGTFKCG